MIHGVILGRDGEEPELVAVATAVEAQAAYREARGTLHFHQGDWVILVLHGKLAHHLGIPEATAHALVDTLPVILLPE